MITLDVSVELLALEISQLEQKELAKGAWAEGRPDDALLILDTLLAESMTPRVACEVYVTQAAFRSERGDWSGSLESLSSAAPLLESSTARVRGSFYHQRAKARKELGDLDAALVDYSGALACWDDDEYQGKAMLNLANVYLLQANIEQAHDYAGKAIRYFRDLQSADLAQAYDTLALIYLAEEKFAEAVRFNRESIALTQNKLWLVEFQGTRTKIELSLLSVLGVDKINEMDLLNERFRFQLVKSSLARTGSLTKTAIEVGLTNKGVDSVVKRYPELEKLRSERKVRRKSIIKR